MPFPASACKRCCATHGSRGPWQRSAAALSRTIPANRYPSVDALAEDVRRFRDNRPVDAYRETWFERAARFGRTHRTAILLILAYVIMRAAVALLAGR